MPTSIHAFGSTHPDSGSGHLKTSASETLAKLIQAEYKNESLQKPTFSHGPLPLHEKCFQARL